MTREKQEDIYLLKLNIMEFRQHHKKHMFDDDQRIALNYEKAIRRLEEMVLEVQNG